MANREPDRTVKYEIINGVHQGQQVQFPPSEAPSEGEQLDYLDVTLICVGRRRLRQVN